MASTEVTEREESEVGAAQFRWMLCALSLLMAMFHEKNIVWGPHVASNAKQHKAGNKCTANLNYNFSIYLCIYLLGAEVWTKGNCCITEHPQSVIYI